MASAYAWIIDHTYYQDLDAEDPYAAPLLEDTEYSRNGTAGPGNAPPQLLERLRQGEGREWRTLVDVDYDGHAAENRVIHAGRYLDWADVAPVSDIPGWQAGNPIPEVDEADEFGPLHDFSQPDSGCVEIQYKQGDGTWKTL